MSRIYIAGVISNGGTLAPSEVNTNLKLFANTRAGLQAQGHTVLDPTTIKLIEGSTWADYMRVTIPMLLQADTIHLLPGWEESKGARLEYYIASELGLTILPLTSGG